MINKQFFLLLFMAFCTTLNAQNFNIQYVSEMSFPGQSIAGVFGFTKQGHEYALVGGSSSTFIVEVTDPAHPVLIKTIPYGSMVWKEIRVYKEIAYASSEGENQGLQVIDLSPLPGSTDLPNYQYFGDGAIAGQLSRAHALEVDTTKGFLYLYGGNIAQGAAVFSLADPYHPSYVGQYNASYIHDGYVDNDTLYGAHIGDGYFSVIDMSNKANPVVLATHPTPNLFTHNTWITKDRKHILTTDEEPNSHITMYDISDLENITEVDRFRCTPGSGSIPHNVYIKGDYAVTAWYTDGVSIVDCSQPDLLIPIGRYDTYGGSGEAFEGAWGVYPYFPSGNLIVSNMSPGKIYILATSYVGASYCFGTIRDAITGMTINGATIEFNAPPPAEKAISNNQGKYKSGYYTPGPTKVICSKAGYMPQEVTVQLISGQIIVQNFDLQPLPSFNLSGAVKNESGNGISGAKVLVQKDDLIYNTTADANGNFTVPNVVSENYTICSGAWGYKNIAILNQNISTNATVEIILARGYRDDFVVEQGWKVSGTVTQGAFERAVPIEVKNLNVIYCLGNDLLTDIGDACYVTENNSTLAEGDLSTGTTILTSPIMDLTGYTQPKIKFASFFKCVSDVPFNNNRLKVFISNGTTELLLYTQNTTNDIAWSPKSLSIPSTVPLTANMQFRVEVNEEALNGVSYTEAGFDAFEIIGAVSGTDDLYPNVHLSAYPNPFSSTFTLNYSIGSGRDGLAVIANALGQVVETKVLSNTEGNCDMGANLPNGIYFMWLQTDQWRSNAITVLRNDKK
jgi:choice-of-anchor B domain-containing protein